MAGNPQSSTSAGLNGEPFDRSRWYVAGASPEATAEEQRRVEVCESYIRSARWGDGTPVSISALVAMNVRGAWPVAYTQGWNEAAGTIDSILKEEFEAAKAAWLHDSGADGPSIPGWLHRAFERIRQLQAAMA